MPLKLQNEDIALGLELPGEGYSGARFDQTAKINQLSFKGIELASQERLPEKMKPNSGVGFVNEFGMHSPLAYELAKQGDQFMKIGVGKLLKDDATYDFLKSYRLQPAAFEWELHDDSIEFTSSDSGVHGYAYRLWKKIELKTQGFVIRYRLENMGEQPIHTEEYAHNFMAIDQQPIGPDYCIAFPTKLERSSFGEFTDDERLLKVGGNEIGFADRVKLPFFISHVCKGEKAAFWQLKHSQTGIQFAEKVEGAVSHINLWGWGHVISPEVFVRIALEPGAFAEWSRAYRVVEIEK